MAIEVIATVMKYDLPPREKYILMLYSNYANPEGEGVWPSQSTIANTSGYSRQTISKVTKILSKAGLLLPDENPDRVTKTWKVNTGWAGDREAVEKIVENESAELPEDVKTILHTPVNTSLHTPVNSSLHNTSLETSKEPLSDEEFWKRKGKEFENRTGLARQEKKHGGFLELALSQKPRAEFPPDVDDLLQAFITKHNRQPRQDEYTLYIKAARQWREMKVTPAHVSAMFDYCREKGTVIKTPLSITFAFNEIRNQKQEAWEWV